MNRERSSYKEEAQTALARGDLILRIDPSAREIDDQLARLYQEKAKEAMV